MKAVEPGSRANRKKTNESRHTYGCSSGDADGGFLSSDGLRLAKADNKELGRKSGPIFSALRACGSHLIFNGSDTFLANQLRLSSADAFEAAADMKRNNQTNQTVSFPSRPPQLFHPTFVSALPPPPPLRQADTRTQIVTILLRFSVSSALSSV